MKTWLGLFLTVMGLALGLSSALLDDTALHHTEYATFFGLSTVDLANHSPLLIGLALVLMVASFFLIFANREDEMEY